VKESSRNELSYAVEMRSRTGFSGSPVRVYRTDATNISVIHPVHFLHGLLGINWGYINDPETGENTWLNGVIPAWKIIETLETPALEKKHKEAEAKIVASMNIMERGADHLIAPPAIEPTNREGSV
jgi:hypothetical protein